MKNYRFFIFVSVFLLTALISSNAFADYGSGRAGFFDGMWDGTVWIGHLIEKVYSDSHVYNDHNNGFFYNLGFFACFVILSWNIGLLLSIILIIIDIAILLFGLILVNKTKIINFSFFASILLISFSILYNLNEKIEKWRNRSKVTTSRPIVKSTNNVGIEDILYKNKELFCDGEFIYERSSKSKVNLERVTNFHIGNTNNICIEFNKKDGEKGSMTVLLSEISEDSRENINKLTEYIKSKNINA